MNGQRLSEEANGDAIHARRILRRLLKLVKLYRHRHHDAKADCFDVEQKDDRHLREIDPTIQRLHSGLCRGGLRGHRARTVRFGRCCAGSIGLALSRSFAVSRHAAGTSVVLHV